MKVPRFVRETARRQLRKLGLAVVRYAPGVYIHQLRDHVLQVERVNLVLDVGANVGQHVDHLRGEGYVGRIVSFEPAADTFRQLSVRTANDPNWEARKLALSDHSGTAQLRKFVASEFNSLLPGVKGAVPEDSGVEEVELTTLDALEGDAWTSSDNICLKVDVQGLEGQVLQGAVNLLTVCRVVDIELSTAPMYDGQSLLPEVAGMLYEAGMRMVSFRPIVVQANGFVDQADALFIRA